MLVEKQTDVSIIIPHRGNPLGLWATVHSCEDNFKGSELSYNFVIVTNGEEVSVESRSVLRNLESSGKLLKHIHSDEPLTPPAARQLGVAAADGEILAFLDNHCLVGAKYFERAVLVMRNSPIDVLHSTTCFYTNDGLHYHYKLKLDYNFWAESAKFPQSEYKPYPIAAGGHGGFFVRRSSWDSIGGYGPDSLFKGYGGEELIFDLKAWLTGHTVYIDPKVIHYHYTGARGYDRHYTDEYYQNLLVSANVIGGEEWMYRVYKSFAGPGHLRLRPKKNMYDIMIDAYDTSAEYAKQLESRRVCDFNELLRTFQQKQVAM